MKFVPANVSSDLDPRLQHLVTTTRMRRSSPWEVAYQFLSSRVSTPWSPWTLMMEERTVALSRPEPRASVVARVTDAEAFASLPGVRRATRIAGAGDGSHIVTAAIDVSCVEAIHANPIVLDLEAGRRLRSSRQVAMVEIGLERDIPPPEAPGARGAGTIIGIVDRGCDFVHTDFRNADGSTRLALLWDQFGTPLPDSPIQQGRIYIKKEIDAALRTDNPYLTLGYCPSEDAHGTHVMSIAAGADGIAPDADLMFVDLSNDIPFDRYQAVDADLGDSAHLLDAIRLIFHAAESAGRPCVINVSLGANGGPHDGSSLVEQGIDHLLEERADRAVVISAGSSYDQRCHASGTLQPGTSTELVWEVAQADSTGNEMEIWYDGGTTCVAEILLPDGRVAMTLAPGQRGHAEDARGRVVLYAAHRVNVPSNQDNCVGLFMDPEAAPAGSWKVRLVDVQGAACPFHAWIERDEIPSHFVAPCDPTHTLGSIACGRLSVAVAAYDSYKSETPICDFSSAGPTRDERRKPELSAPGLDIWGARSISWMGHMSMSGTSMAAPTVTGVVALMLSEARRLGLHLTAEEIRRILTDTARKNPPNTPWDPRYGYGRVDTKAALEGVSRRGGSMELVAASAPGSA